MIQPIRFAIGTLSAIFMCLGLSTIARAQSAQDRITQPINMQQVVKLNDRLSVLDNATDLGHLNPNTQFDRMVLVLKPSAAQQQALDNLVQSQQEKGSSNYHQWLTPQQFGAQFGASQNDVNKITAWLQGQGFHVDQVPNSRLWIAFSGTSGQVEQSFRTQIHNYSVNGEQHIANATVTSIPQALSPVVGGILSLHNFFSKPNITPTKKAGPSTDLGNGNFALSPADYATIYDINPLYKAGTTGAGQTIAIVGRSDIDPVDIADFRAMTGLPAANFQTIVNGPDPGTTADVVEQTLDVSWSGAVAPGAMIDLVVSGSTATTDGVDLSASYIVDNDLAPVMSTSYGSCEQFLFLNGTTYWSTLWEQAAAEGISTFVSAGDSGGAGCDSPDTETAAQLGFAVNGLASTPFNVAVGGTEFNDTANPAQYWAANNNTANISSALGYIPEMAWNESGTTANNDLGAPNIYAGSGGASLMVPKPTWQTGTGVPADGVRDLPDVSLTAAIHDGYILCLRAQGGDCSQGYFFLVGGTSASSPSFAGIMALINQQTNSIQGNPNPTIYALANSSSYGTIFHDTTVGDNKVPAADGNLIGYSTTPSFDLATGWGSVDVNQLATAWMQVGTGQSTVALTATPTSITHGTPVTLSATVTPGGSAAATPTGDVGFLASSNNVNTSLGLGTLASGATQLQTNILPGGTQSVVGHYAGDPNYASISSSPVNITVAPENSNVTLVASGSSYGLPVTMNATVMGATSGLQTATGPVVFKDGVTTLGTQTLIGGNINGTALQPSGSTSYTAPYLSAGTHNLTASYSGDVSYNAATSATSTVTILPATALLTLESSNLSPLANTPVTLTAQVVLANGGSPSAPITGTVSFIAEATSPAILGTAPVAATSTSSTTGFYVAQLPVTFKTQGAQLIGASYSGDANVSFALPADLTINVTSQSATRTSLTTSAPSGGVLSGASVAFTATVAGDTTPPPTPTGTVTFYDNGASIGTGTVTNGVATFTTTKLADGVQNITASYSGDANFFTSQSAMTPVQVNDFTFTANPTSVTLVQGQGTQVVLTLAATANTAITTPIAITCSGMPTGGSCSLTPASVTPGTGQAESALFLSTTGPTLAPALRHNTARLESQRAASGMAIRLGGALLLGLPLLGFGFRRKGHSMQKLLGLVGLVVLIGMVGCGGGPQKYTISSAGTPAGQATITVTAKDGTLVHTTTIALTVQSAITSAQ